ncbi:MAG: cytidine deaminase [Ruminiclostridium sp.]|nr:cytidine deaminase [Ruminiclostridium sp.]
MDKSTVERLIKAAAGARENAYAPYSGYRVGAAVLADGEIYTGCNVESASYPCGICAERAAAAKAVGEGRRGIGAVAVIGSSGEVCTPCGMCRQFLYEFGEDMTVICCDRDGGYETHTMKELLPFGFGSSSMK